MDIDRFFPFKSYRPGQKEAIEFIIKAFAQGKKYVFLEAPTGIGKSAMAYTIARILRESYIKSYYLTSTKILQSQLINDFGDNSFVDLKGRNAYNCSFWGKALREAKEGKRKLRPSLVKILDDSGCLSCAHGYCKLVEKKSKLEYCLSSGLCPYWNRRDQAVNADVCVMNFDSFLYQTQYSNFGDGQVRGFMTIDETHNAEGKLLDFVSISISDKLIKMRLRPKKTPEDYVEYFKNIDLKSYILDKAAEALQQDDISRYDSLISMSAKLSLIYNDVNNDEWVCNFVKKDSYSAIELKPIYIRKYFHPLISSRANKILMMSATILSDDIMRDSLGISRDDSAFLRMDSIFDRDKRPIYCQPVGKLSFKHKYGTYPKLVSKIDKICDENSGYRGIIHTHNFEISELLMTECASNDRFLYQRDFRNKTEMLREHDNRSNGIIVAPAMYEGIDLRDDKSRFQIICKVPYPNAHANPQLKKRSELSWGYYIWLTAYRICQAYGRSIRSEDDWANTYILDTDFKRFLQMSVDILPDWFIEALQL